MGLASFHCPDRGRRRRRANATGPGTAGVVPGQGNPAARGRVSFRVLCCRNEVTGMTTTRATDRDFRAQLAGYSLTTAEILYRMPDHPALLQSFIWQEYDVHPLFPRLHGFLQFWARNLEGKLFRVTVAHRRLIAPTELKLVAADYKLH
jgi:uncharacterized protein Usg